MEIGDIASLVLLTHMSYFGDFHSLRSVKQKGKERKEVLFGKEQKRKEGNIRKDKRNKIKLLPDSIYL